MSATTEAQSAAAEYAQAQRQFMQLYQQYLVNEGVKIAPDCAQLTTQKIMVGAAQMVAGKNLEDLDDFARDYIVGKEGI